MYSTFPQQNLHGSAFVGACLAATFLVDGAIAAGPVVIAAAGAVTVALPMTTAAIQAVCQLDRCQIITYLI